jgi:hypothetical protein
MQPIDARADVFAAGIVLWELAAGRRLYRVAEGGASLLEQARRAEVPELPTETSLPAADELRRVLARALAPDRDARYLSASMMQRELEEYTIRAKLMTSPLQLGEWLSKTFGEDIVASRRARERAAAALEKGAPLVLETVTASSTSVPVIEQKERVPAVLSPPPKSRSAAAIAMVAVMVIVTLAVAIAALAAR